MNSLRCSACKIEKPLTAFHKCKAAKHGVRWQCKECRSYINKADYSTNRERWSKKDKKDTEFLFSLKKGPCMDCGNTYHPICMDFDHRDRMQKTNIVSRLRHNRKLLLEEIAKCDLVCSNCHRLRTYNNKHFNKRKYK